MVIGFICKKKPKTDTDTLTAFIKDKGIQVKGNLTLESKGEVVTVCDTTFTIEDPTKKESCSSDNDNANASETFNNENTKKSISQKLTKSNRRCRSKKAKAVVLQDKVKKLS